MFYGVFIHEETAEVGDEALWDTWMVDVQTHWEAFLNMFLRSASSIQEGFFFSWLKAKPCSRNSRFLWAGQSRDRIPVRVRFSTLGQTDRGAHPTSHTMGTGSFLRLKPKGCSIDHPPLSSTEVKERVELYFYSLSGPFWFVLGWPLPLCLVLGLLFSSAGLSWLLNYWASDRRNFAVLCLVIIKHWNTFFFLLFGHHQWYNTVGCCSEMWQCSHIIKSFFLSNFLFSSHVEALEFIIL